MSFPKYLSYRDTDIDWLGPVPTHWAVGPLKRLLSIENGCDHKDVQSVEGVPVYGSGGVFAYATDYLYDGESILFGRKGTIDKPLYVNGKFWTVDTMYWSKLRDGFDGRFGYYMALCFPFAYYSTNTALPSLTKSVLENHKVSIPPINEQRQLAHFLDRETAKIDALVAEQERLIRLLKEKRQGVIWKAITKGLELNVPMKDSGVEWLGLIPAHWSSSRFKWQIDRNDGGVWGDNPDGEDDTIVLRSTEQTVDGHWRMDNPAARKLSKSERASALLAEGDLVVTKSSGSSLHIGKTTIVTAEIAAAGCCYSNFMQRVRTRSSFLPKLAWYVMNNDLARLQFDLASNSTTGLANLNGTMIGAIVLAVPPLDEQERIVSFLRSECERIDSLISEADLAITLLAERRLSLISAAVTGQVDVRKMEVV
jgi:type I restriction enzyme S subunit